MKLRTIKTELDYQNALQEIEQLFDAEPNSPECVAKPCRRAYLLDILTTLFWVFSTVNNDNRYYKIVNLLETCL